MAITFYDTNALLRLRDKAFQEPFYISSITLEEIEHIKSDRGKDESTKYDARKVAHLLDENDDKYTVVFYGNEVDQYLADNFSFSTVNNDIKICASAAWIARDNEVLFVTDDINCKNIARGIFKLKVKSIGENEEDIYKGYRLLQGNTAEINDYLFDPEYINTFYENEYLLIYNTDTDSQSEMKRIHGAFEPLKLPPSRIIKAKNALQRCALDILNNPSIPIAAILGGYGSGKTFLSMRMGVYQVNDKGNQSKILGVREPSGEGKEVGFLPGEFDSKTDRFFLPLEQQLDGGKFELENLKQCGVLESTIPFYLKGTSYNNTIIIVDEAEDLNKKALRLVGTRLGENSRIFLAGDYKQAVVNASDSNPLVEMCNAFKGDPKFACIYLGEDVRSEASKMFADLFN